MRVTMWNQSSITCGMLHWHGWHDCHTFANEWPFKRPFQFILELFGTICSSFCLLIILHIDFISRNKRLVLYFS